MLNNLALSMYVMLVVKVPTTHADHLREVMGRAGAGNFGTYSFCSWSTKGTGRFVPNDQSQPHIGTEYVKEEVEEEKIETVCPTDCLEQVIAAIKAAHPYEATVIEIRPLYEIGCKFTR